ncbi:MAG: glutaminyl-peptide cyclotransferase [Acidobacteria bacterium]|nr:glutaminyl-peptide cyclotransferase [Acidobacteriota bacterium]MCA1638904.1 glutaminyl-peptide cyclotransferase [Acidobacteriota bacterium]
MRLYLIYFVLLLSLACDDKTKQSNANLNTPSTTNTNSIKNASNVPVYTYEIVNTFKHDPKAFTQGLFFYNGFLYEGTGQERKSSLRKVELESGKVLQQFDLPKESFGEGATILNGKIYQLTWREGRGFVYDAETLKLLGDFKYQGEGWGLTSDGKNLFMTDSTHVIRVVDPETFQTIRTLVVFREDGKPLMQINELEFVKGEIWANVWHSENPNILGKPNHIARIDPQSGKLLGWINLDGISPDDVKRSDENTLNGIAYDAQNDRIFVTGKNWKKLFEIKVKPK